MIKFTRFSLVATLLLAACATPSERVTLLPQEGKETAVIVTNQQGKVEVLSSPYATADITRKDIQPSIQDQQYVNQHYADLLAYTPKQPEQFELFFRSNSDELTTESQAKLSSIVEKTVSIPAVEVIIVGYTDSVGGLEYNDKLSLQRAAVMRNILIAAGIPVARISVAGRGERELLVKTSDEIDEPRNRRVVIKLR